LFYISLNGTLLEEMAVTSTAIRNLRNKPKKWCGYIERIEKERVPSNISYWSTEEEAEKGSGR
jgi:hypothetical protein